MKAGKSPRKWRETTVAATEEITMGLNWEMPKSLRMISIANRAPAIGALKVPAMPAAVPQATRVLSDEPVTRRNCPIVEPSAEPICTMGPSRPTEPPDPMHTAEAAIFASTTRGRMDPERSTMDSITSGTPWPLASRAK